jgi:hypothetical protein
MDKHQKQIEEMARVICGFACDYENCDICPFNSFNVPCEYQDYSINLIKACYRKIPENAAVLTKAKLAQIQSNLFDAGIKHGSKETAEKFVERLKLRLFEYMDNDISYEEFCKGNIVCGEIDEIYKEITEGK